MELELPPAVVLKQMSNVIKRRCGHCKCHVQLTQDTGATKVTYDPSKEE